MAKTKNRFGKELRRLRLEKGVGLRELAVACNLSPTYISRVETGTADPPNAGRLRKIAKVLDVHEAKLLMQTGRNSDQIAVVCYDLLLSIGNANLPQGAVACLNSIRDILEEGI